MSSRAILLGDKIPLIVSVGLTAFGWYFTTIASYFSDQTALHISKEEQGATTRYVIENISISRLAENQLFDIRCVGTTVCFKPVIIDGEKRSGAVHPVAPFAVKANNPCYQDEHSFSFTVTLPPEAKAIVDVYSEFKQNQIYFVGRTQTPCASGVTDAADTRILLGLSVTAIFLTYFIHFYILSIAVLIVVFIFTLYRLLREEPNDGIFQDT
jgi:hypothetical protein